MLIGRWRVQRMIVDADLAALYEVVSMAHFATHLPCHPHHPSITIRPCVTGAKKISDTLSEVLKRLHHQVQVLSWLGFSGAINFNFRHDALFARVQTAVTSSRTIAVAIKTITTFTYRNIPSRNTLMPPRQALSTLQIVVRF
jgi:hypothetical protein